MADNFYQEAIAQINKAQIQLQIRLEQVSRLKIDCVKLQLELLKLYKPGCLEILATLQDILATTDAVDENNGDGGNNDDGQSRQ